MTERKDLIKRLKDTALELSTYYGDYMNIEINVNRNISKADINIKIISIN